MRYVFNGLYHEGGQKRFFEETLLELDKMVSPNLFCVVKPEWQKCELKLKNIDIISVGKCNAIIWLQVFFPIYLVKNKLTGINMFNFCPLIKPDYTVIHDLTPLFFTPPKKNMHIRLSSMYWALCRNSMIHFGKTVFTVSNASKSDIQKIYNIPSQRIVVLGNSWEHFQRIESDYSVFEKFPELKKGAFYLSLGSLAPNKNLEWINKNAMAHPFSEYAICGKIIKLTNKDDISKSPNIHYLGFLSDGEVKALFENCKAFVFPSFYEGFGIPPLEALSVGAKIVVSRASCLPEIYEDCAYYIDPGDPSVDLDELIKKEVAPPDRILAKYSWQGVAEALINALPKEGGYQ